MDFFADTDLPTVPKSIANKFKFNTYFDFAKRQIRMQCLIFVMGYTCTEGYWPKVKQYCEEIMNPPMECDDLKLLAIFLVYLSLSVIFASPIQLGRYTLNE